MTYCQKCADSNDGFWGSWVGECDEHGPNAKPKEKIKELTKEEKIKEVMDLVDSWSGSEYGCSSAVISAKEIGSTISEIQYAEFCIGLVKEKRAAIESKLRELIQ